MNVKVAIIGCGYWGQNLARNFYQLGSLHTVCDIDPVIQNEIRVTFCGVNVCAGSQQVFSNKEIQAVVIATPAIYHYQQAREALLNDKDVFVEKPLTLDVKEGEELVQLAKARGRILMVGHLLHYHPAIHRLKQLVKSGALGKVHYISSNRSNLGKILQEENVLWSLATHDISVILGLLDELPTGFNATGSRCLHPRIDDATASYLSFASGVSAHIFVSWLHPFKEQKLVIVGSK